MDSSIDWVDWITDIANMASPYHVISVGYGGYEIGADPSTLSAFNVEAQKLGIPVVGIVDTNNSPKGVDYVIPGNDDAARAIALYCELIARAALDGMSAQMGAAGIDLGALEEAPTEEAIADA